MILKYEDYAHDQSFDADVAVVGTGAGGAVAGAELAAAGYSVVFVEEGSYHATPSFNPYVTESVPRLYRDASATVIMGAPPIPFIEGRCVGGSTVINGGMTWRIPEKVCATWAAKSGLSELSAKSLESYFLEVEREISASPQRADSIGNDNRMMQEGAEKLGWSYLHNQRNQRECVGANNCVLGCPTGAKQSTLVSHIPQALSRGAVCLTEAKVTKLLVDRGRCVGVEAVSLDRATRSQTRVVRVRARAVVIACGAVQTPLLLQAQRALSKSKWLGRNFTCHPNAKVLGVYPFEVRAWQGVSQAGQIREFESQGIKLAENMIPPGALAAQLPFHGQEAWQFMQDYHRMVLSGVMINDSTTGVVKSAPFGLGGARYQITDNDHERLLTGVSKLAELHFAMGASKVILPFANKHVVDSVDALNSIDRHTIKKSTLDMFTVHLMGTAQIGSRAESSAVDATGQLWELPGCYVADASLFPTAATVNPQIGIMALAKLVAQRIVLPRRIGRPAQPAAAG